MMMTALLLYAYCSGLYSSRRIAKACRERVDFMSIVGLDALVDGPRDADQDTPPVHKSPRSPQTHCQYDRPYAQATLGGAKFRLLGSHGFPRATGVDEPRELTPLRRRPLHIQGGNAREHRWAKILLSRSGHMRPKPPKNTGGDLIGRGSIFPPAGL